MKTLLLIPLILLVILYPYQPSSNTANTTAGNVIDNNTWQLGDDIIPLPTNLGDCDDETLYSYYWLKSAGYEPEIMYGYPALKPNSRHVWIRVNGYDYDYGKAYTPETLFISIREISYKQLVDYVAADLRR